MAFFTELKFSMDTTFSLWPNTSMEGLHTFVMKTVATAAISNCGKLCMTNTEITKEWESSQFYDITQNIQLEKEIMEFSDLFLLKYVMRMTNPMHMGKFCTYQLVPKCPYEHTSQRV